MAALVQSAPLRLRLHFEEQLLLLEPLQCLHDLD
jgi:hypothetical protein